MIVLDASAAVAGLLADGPARARMAGAAIHAPHLIDVEITEAIRRQVPRRILTAKQATNALETWLSLDVTRYPFGALGARVWQLRGNLSAYDATYVALAEALAVPLLTADGRLAASPGLRCVFEVVPNT